MAEPQRERDPRILEKIGNLGSNPKISPETEKERRTITQIMRAQAVKTQVEGTIQEELDKGVLAP